MTEKEIRETIAVAVQAKLLAENEGMSHMDERYTPLVRAVRDAIDLMYEHGYAINPETV